MLVAFAATARAAPKSAPAKAAFEDGIAAYQKEDWPAASAAFGKSYGLEADTETLFAWAQAERKLGHCDKALDLYDKLLASNLDDENAKAVRDKRDECHAIIAAEKPAPEPVQPPPALPPRPPIEHERAWYRDPVGDGLAIGGLVAIGAGTALLVAGHAADHGKASAPTYAAFVADRDRAARDGTIGVVAGSVGIVAVGASVAWYVTHRHQTHRAMIGWIDSTSAGVSVAVRF